MSRFTADEWVSKLNLQPHPEGGFYREIHRSLGSIPPEYLEEGIATSRTFVTSIYFLITSKNFSAFHRIRQDEIWHFYDGSPIRIHVISVEGAYHAQTLGLDPGNDIYPQFVVPARNWFAVEVIKNNSFGLVGCTVAPGFEFEDFEMGERSFLTQEFPQHREIIEKFTR